MNSTKLLRQFFNRFIIPTSLAIESNKAKIHSRKLLGPAVLTDSLYQSGPFGPDFTETRVEDIAEKLEQIWLDDDLQELTLLAKPVVDLAVVLHEQDRDKTKSISDTSYVMY